MTASDTSGSSSVAPTADEIRAHELYKYFRPPLEDGSSPDQILTAHAQLVAWRLDAERSMISLIDEEVQYFVAESTKTLHLDNAHKHDHPDDAIWAGCVRVSKAGRLCEHTIAATAPESGGPACFEVVQLMDDPRFNTLEFVAGPPHFKHYAGVPLRTRKGVNIGSIFIIDSRTRSPLTKSDWHFLGVVADNVIKHLEMTKDQNDSMRSLKMNACIAAYVDPLHLRQDKVESGLEDHISVLGPLRERGTEASGAVDAERLSVYKRAAGWLLQGLDFDESGGGVMFLDTLPPRNEPTGSKNGNFTPPGGVNFTGAAQEISGAHKSPSDSDKEQDAMDTDILAHAIQRETDGSESGLMPTDTISPKDLHKLTQHYPDGKLFTFSSRYALVNSSDDASSFPSSIDSSLHEKEYTSKSHARKLQRFFPKARQIVLLPVWDTSVSRWVVCIAYHRSKYHHMSYKSEFVFCATFTKTLMAELSKLAVLQANQQKSDFITSISHELRSPLHGILASCDFLDDTDLTQFQQSLVGTADNCARTLLDTINMVLDYSNINRFERTRDRIKKGQRHSPDRSQPKALQTSLSTHHTFDIAALVEEVVDSLIAGHNFEDRPKRSGSISAGMTHSVASTARDGTEVSIHDDRVSVILDIPAREWIYRTEPGALRRIVLNLVGNALKFTQRGFVHIKLDIDTAKKSAASPRLILTVIDSGQGISPTYLRDKLYSPFSQESNLTSGTGLGLSLVKSIVRTMGGKIQLDSSPGVGTTVTVKLPVTHEPLIALGMHANANPVHFDDAAERQRSSLINTVRVQAPVGAGALFWQPNTGDSDIGDKVLQMLQTSLLTYLSRWFGLSVSPWQHGVPHDIVIATFDGLSKLRQLDPSLFTPGNRRTILAIDTAAARNVSRDKTPGTASTVVLRCPFGPSKLAHALSSCLAILKSGQSDRSENQCEAVAEKVFDANFGNTVGQTSNTSDILTNGVPRQIHQQDSTAGDEAQVDELAIRSKPVPGQCISAEVDLEICKPARSLPQSTSVGTPPETISSGITSSQESSSERPLPQHTPDLLNVMPVPKESMTATAKLMASHPRMLLVDDNSINLRLLQLYCKKLGATNTHSAENGQIAVDIYAQLLQATPSTPPSVVFMDLSMPVLDGFEATRRIRQIEEKHNMRLENGAAHRSLIIALTGLASLKDQKEAFAAGVDRYLMKPVKFANLTQILVEEGLQR